MRKQLSTKKALLASMLSMLLCVAMLLGSTYAWFTDTATTAVNTIQAGTLDVALEMQKDDGTWVSAEGETLEFKKASGATAGEAVLWEPGCTYELPALRVVNKGTLALKYRIQITGIDGDAKLNDAIEWTISDTSLDSDHKLAANATSDALTIKGHMKEDAGNEYQGLTIDGIGITVYATQDAVEYDSNGNDYDATAVYPPISAIVKAKASGTVADAAVDTVITDTKVASDAVVTATIPANTVPADSKVELSLDRTALSADSITFDIDFKIDDATPTTALANPVSVEVNVGAGLKNVKVTHNGTAMTEGTTGADQTYSYDATTGILTIVTKTFSPFEIKYETDFTAKIGSIGYATFDKAVQSAKEGETVVLLKSTEISATDYNVSNRLAVNANNLTIDLNGNTLTVPNHTFTLLGNNITLKNGKIVTTTTTSGQTYGSYAVAATGTNITIDGVEMLGGVSVTGYYPDEVVYNKATATIVNCKITATNYYTVCSQGEASATVKNSTLIAENGIAFFWIEKEDGTVANSSLCYDADTVTMTGSKPLYNAGGLAPVVKSGSTCYPAGVTTESFPESVDCTTGTGSASTAPATAVYIDANGVAQYVADITDAIEAGATVVYVKENVTVSLNLSTPTNRTTDLTADLTVYANGANFQHGTVSINMTDAGKAANITLKIYDANDIYVWGASPKAGVTQTVVLENCHNEGTSATDSNARMFYITGNTGTVDVTLRNCTVAKAESPVYMNCNGSVTVENCSFSECATAMKLSLKATSGTTAVTVSNTTFDKCGWTEYDASRTYLTEDSSSIKIKTKSSDGATLTLNNVAITNVVGSNSIVVDGESSYTGTTTVNAKDVTVDGVAWSNN